MKKIPLTQGKFALVDNKDYEELSKHTWCAEKRRNNFYAGSNIDGKRVRMHQFILGNKKGFEVDHKNRNGLDNRRKNLRHSTHSQNLANARIRTTRASSYRGVYYSKERNKWRALIGLNYKTHFIGYYKTQKEAAIAYNKKAKEIFKEFSNLNRIK